MNVSIGSEVPSRRKKGSRVSVSSGEGEGSSAAEAIPWVSVVAVTGIRCGGGLVFTRPGLETGEFIQSAWFYESLCG